MTRPPAAHRFWQRRVATARLALPSPQVHADVKPTNIFLLMPERECVPVLKLGDFGLATPLDKCCSDGRASSGGFAGTPAYAAPEVISGMSTGGAGGDAWSAGCVVQELCTLSKAFASRHLTALLRIIVHNQRAPLRPSPYSEELLDVVEGLLLPDLDARLSASTALPRVRSLIADILSVLDRRNYQNIRNQNALRKHVVKISSIS